MAFAQMESTEYLSPRGAKYIQNAKEASKILTGYGWSKEAIAAFLGNCAKECTLNYKLLEKGVSNPGFGWVQWTNSAPPPSGPDYLRTLFNASGQSADDVYNGEHQLKRIKWESENNFSWYNASSLPNGTIDGTWVNYGQIYRNISFKQFTTHDGDPQRLALTFIYAYLRPRYADAKIPQRMAEAQWFYEQDWLGGEEGGGDGDEETNTPEYPSNPDLPDNEVTDNDKLLGEIVQAIKDATQTPVRLMSQMGMSYANDNIIINRISGNMYMVQLTGALQDMIDGYEDQHANNNNTGSVPDPVEPKPVEPPEETEPSSNVDEFISEMRAMVKLPLTYVNARPQGAPKDVGYADCSIFIGYALRNIFPSVWNNSYCNTGTIHVWMRDNGKMIWSGRRTDIPWDRVKKGMIANFGMTPELGAGLQSHIVGFTNDNGAMADMNGSGSMERTNGKEIIMNWYNHTYAAIYDIDK